MGSVAATGLLEKKSFVSLFRPRSEKGVRGVVRLRSEEEELSAVRKLVLMLEKSLSPWMELEEDELVSEPSEILRISGALRAWTLVVERSSVGREILARLIEPAVYLAVRDRGRTPSSPRLCARARVVNFRTRDMVLGEVDMVGM